MRELSAVRLVVYGDPGVRPAGLGADPRIHQTGRRFRVRIPVRAGVLHPAAAVDQRIGRAGSRGWRCRSCRRCSRRLFGLLAVAVRRLPGWPLWFAALWVAQEWAKSTVPFGGFPWGVVGFSQTNGPLLPIAQFGGAPLLSLRRRADRIQPGGDRAGDRAMVAARRPHPTAGGGAARRVHQRRPPDHRVDLAAGPPVRCGRRRRPDGHRGGGAGQRAAARAGVQRPAPRRARQPRPRNRPAGRRRARRTRARSRCSSSGRRTPRISTRWPTRTPPTRSRSRRAAINAPILVGGVLAAPGYSRDNPVSTNSVIVWDPRHRPRRTPRQADRAAVRRVPAVARFLPSPVAVRRPGRLLRARQRHRCGAAPPACRSGSPPAGR